MAQVKVGEYVTQSQEVDELDWPAPTVYRSKLGLDTDFESDPAERMHPTLCAPSNYLRARLKYGTYQSMRDMLYARAEGSPLFG